MSVMCPPPTSHVRLEPRRTRATTISRGRHRPGPAGRSPSARRSRPRPRQQPSAAAALLFDDGDQSFGELRGSPPCLPLIASRRAGSGRCARRSRRSTSRRRPLTFSSSSVRKKPGSTIVVWMPKAGPRTAATPSIPQPRTRGGVGRAELLPDDASCRRDRDDISRPLPAHHGQHRARDVHRPDKVRRQRPLDLLRRQLLEEAGVEVARVVDQHVDTAEPLEHRLHRRLRRREACDVELDDEQVVSLAESFGHSFDVRPVATTRGRRRGRSVRCRRPSRGRHR